MLGSLECWDSDVMAQECSPHRCAVVKATSVPPNLTVGYSPSWAVVTVNSGFLPRRNQKRKTMTSHGYCNTQRSFKVSPLVVHPYFDTCLESPEPVAMAVSIENATSPKSTKSRNSDSSVSRWFKSRFWFNLNLHWKFWASGFGGFRGRSIFSGMSRMWDVLFWVKT